MKITIQYGTGNVASLEVAEGTTIDAALQQVRAQLGFGQSVEGHVEGVPQPPTTTLAEGDTVEVHDKACTKAVA
jgi:hypothetical protein